MPKSKTTSPEEKELLIKTEELNELENTLLQLELEFNSLQAEMFTFQKRYVEFVINRMRKLDQIEVEIAQYLVSTDPNNPEYRQRLNKFKEQVAEAEETIARDEQESARKDIKPSDSLKSLYRDAARKIHPDFADDDKERERRTKLMAEVNEAYQQGDEKKLEQIMQDWHYDPENVSGDDIGSRLIKTIRKIAQVQKRILVIEKETKAIQTSELYKLVEKSRENVENGVDLLIEMSGYLDVQIHERAQYLDFLKNGGK